MQGEAIGLLEAAAWGASGGLAAALVSLMAAIRSASFRMPWRKGEPSEEEAREEFWARAFVLGGGIALGALVAAAAHAQMSGPWPAFIIGAGAEASVRGMLAGVEVTVRDGAAGEAMTAQVAAGEALPGETGTAQVMVGKTAAGEGAAVERDAAEGTAVRRAAGDGGAGEEGAGDQGES